MKDSREDKVFSSDNAGHAHAPAQKSLLHAHARCGILAFIFSFTAANCFSQELTSHTHSISLNFLQIKEGLNYGLVFSGPGLNYIYAWRRKIKTNEINYEMDFGLTYMKTRGVEGFSLHFVPLKANYLFHMENKKLKVGPLLVAEYNYEVYPNLQSGYSFWFTHFSLGASVEYLLSAGKNNFNLKLNTTLLGFTSRPPLERDPYFFDLSVGYAIRFLHHDLQFGSLGQYNVTELEIQWKPKEASRIAYAYNIQYSGYYDAPEITMLNMSLKVIFIPKIK